MITYCPVRDLVSENIALIHLAFQIIQSWVSFLVKAGLYGILYCFRVSTFTFSTEPLGLTPYCSLPQFLSSQPYETIKNTA